MHQQHSQMYYTREERFSEYFPLGFVAILAIIQMLSTFAIIGLEIGHIIINIRYTNLFVGIWTAIPFTILWLSMFGAVCCCRRRSCAVHAVIQSCISFIFSIILVGINIAFIEQPYNCFFTTEICETLPYETNLPISWDCANDYYGSKCKNIRLGLIKGQLGAGALIGLTCFIYMISYCIVSSRASRAHRRQIPPPAATDAMMVPAYPQINLTGITNQPQAFTNPGPSAPVMIQGYPQVSTVNPNGYYLPSNPYPALYPKISTDRF